MAHLHSVGRVGDGGYLAGRLRTKWLAVDTDEVYFRDTAHGFLAWAVATVGTAALLTSAVTSVVGAGLQAGASVAGGASATIAATATGAAAAAGSERSASDSGEPLPYFVDSLFRPRGSSDAKGLRTCSGHGRIPGRGLAHLRQRLRTGSLPRDDVRYVGQVVAERTDLTQQEAEARVNEAFARLQTTLDEAETAAREAADAAREAAARTALWLFISLLIGAFVASWMATFGGRQRDLKASSGESHAFVTTDLSRCPHPDRHSDRVVHLAPRLREVDGLQLEVRLEPVETLGLSSNGGEHSLGDSVGCRYIRRRTITKR